MLRSAKLLPLCKGARTWLVAGTVYGPKASVDGGDDNRQEQERNKDVKVRDEFKKPIGAEKSAVHHSHSTDPSVGRRSPTFHQNVLRANQYTASTTGYPELVPGDGLASVGRISSFKSSGTQVSADRKRSSASQEAASRSDAPVKAEGRHKGDSPVQPSVEAVLNVKDDGISATQSAAASHIFETVDVRSELEKPILDFEGSELHSKDVHYLSRNSSSTILSSSSTVPATSTTSCISTETHNLLENQIKHDVVGQHSSTKKYTSSRHGRRNNNNNSAISSSSSSDSSHKIVNRVCSILHQLGWGCETTKALEKLNANLSAYQVNEILKQQREAGLSYNFFIWVRKQAGFKHDVHTYTTMLGILGRAKNFELVNKLLKEMLSEGCEPNVVTYNRLIHCYGRANQLDASLRYFNHMRQVGCEPDRVTYCTLIDLQAKAGFHDTAMELYKQMQLAGFRPDTFTYSIIIHCLGKAGKLNAAYKLFCEMTERGFAPSLVTYNIIIDLHAKAGKFDMALKLYSDLQEAGYSPDRVTYGIVMEVLGTCGHIEEAESVFEEMERAGWVADNPIFGLMVDMWGKHGNADKAAGWFHRMLDSGLHPNVPACNSLLSAYLRSYFYDAARQVLLSMISKWKLIPTLQTYTCLLNSCAVCQARWEYDLLFSLMATTRHAAHPLLCSLLTGGSNCATVSTVNCSNMSDCCGSVRHFFEEEMQFEEMESKRGFADSLIDFLHKLGRREAARDVWQVASDKNLYPYAIKEKAPNYWSINLHVMSMGTALVALTKTLSGLRESMMRTGNVPYRVDIITGWGKRSRVTGSSLVKQGVEDMLNALGSPFRIDSANVGCFVGQGRPLADWLCLPHVEQMLLVI